MCDGTYDSKSLNLQNILQKQYNEHFECHSYWSRFKVVIGTQWENRERKCSHRNTK
jgi:hypothetical protein